MQFAAQYNNNELYVENVSVKDIAEKIGTPSFIYSYDSMAKNFQGYVDAFSEIEPIICYSVKANSNIAILKIFSGMGAGFDIVSDGELKRVLKAGGDTSKVVFSGVGKTDQEIKEALDANILFFNVESTDELLKINQLSKEYGKKAPIALRVNPDIDPDTHPYISTGFKKSKFGIEISKAVDVYKQASIMEGVKIVGIDAHIGSQIFELNSFKDSLKKLIDLANELESEGIDINYIDIGGGLGISYKKEETPPDINQYAKTIIDEIGSSDYKIVLEPGRSLTGNSGIMVTKVLYKKEGIEKKFLIVDAAMNDLIRPSFYKSYHEIIPVNEDSSEKEIVDIVGPICESGDFLALDREFSKVNQGDYLAVLSTGAYGFVMASNYNTRPRAAEVMVKDKEFFVIREREKFEDLIKGESIPDFLSQ